MKSIKNRHPYSKIYILLSSIIGFFLLVFFIYVSHYYHATDLAQQALMSTEKVRVSSQNHILVFTPQQINATTGLIFYPGAKVEASAYAPLMQEIASQGYLCIIAKMPFNLAFFSINVADTIISTYPEIQSWYLAGHSLGGAMAANYASTHTLQLNGLILLAAYSTADLSQTNLRALSILGSNDQVLNYSHFLKYQSNLPINFTEYLIKGGNHAYYADYGDQKGDGKASITRATQISLTAHAIINMMKNQIIAFPAPCTPSIK